MYGTNAASLLNYIIFILFYIINDHLYCNVYLLWREVERLKLLYIGQLTRNQSKQISLSFSVRRWLGVERCEVLPAVGSVAHTRQVPPRGPVRLQLTVLSAPTLNLRSPSHQELPEQCFGVSCDRLVPDALGWPIGTRLRLTEVSGEFCQGKWNDELLKQPVMWC